MRGDIPTAHVLLATLWLAVQAPAATAHGGVVLEDDLCLIEVGYLEGHFKIFLPRQRGHTEYCEDLPAAGETVFVMEYEHEGLARAPVDFRIVRNDTGLGRYARFEDIEGGDLDAITVFHAPPSTDPNVYTAVHEFAATGDYIGIVTAWPDPETVYTAVFPFRIGYAGYGHWFWLGLLLALIFVGLRRARTWLAP